MQPLIKIAVICETPDHVSFFTELIRCLYRSGRIEATMLICGDQRSNFVPGIDCVYIPADQNGKEGMPLHWDSITGYEEYLIRSGIDTTFQGHCEEVARNLSIRLADWLCRNPVDCLLLWSGVRLIPRTAQALAKSINLPVITLESPYFPFIPDTPCNSEEVHLHFISFAVLIWDIIQGPQCGPSQIAEEYLDYETNPSLYSFLDLWKAQKISKFSKDDIVRCLERNPAIKGKEPTVAMSFPKGKRILLVCGQLDKDSSMFFGNHLARCWRDLVNEIPARLPGDWHMLYKPHPFDSFREAEIIEHVAQLGACYGNCAPIPSTANTHDTIQMVDAVACINSNIGLEAAAYGKPVIAFGEGPYTKKGFTFDLSALDDLKPTLQSLPEGLTERQLQFRDRFLSYILWQYLITVGRPERAIERIEKAIACSLK